MKYYSTDQHQGNTNTWLTPRRILDNLGEFDTDPCAAAEKPEHTGCVLNYTSREDGLTQEWAGSVFMNPPYSRQGGAAKIDDWMKRLADHGDGIALVFARMDTRWWKNYVWESADAVVFLHKRVRFCFPDGTESRAGIMTSALVAYGEACVNKLRSANLPGQFFLL